ncbi:MAG: methylmalonyl-CoA mutase family protein [Chitinophagales bacterium]
MAGKILETIYKTFPKSTKADWEKQAGKDLKGKDLVELNWQINTKFQLEAYYTEEEIENLDHGILQNYNPDWQIAQDYWVENYQESNSEILADLMHGLDAPILHFAKEPSLGELKKLFEGIDLAYISTHFANPSLELYSLWNQVLKEKNIAEAPVYFYFSKEQDLCSVKSIYIDLRKDYSGEESLITELKSALKQAKDHLENSQNKSYCAKQLFFCFYVDSAYFLSIAKLRAFKLLFVDMLKEYNLNLDLPFIRVELAPEKHFEITEDELVPATSMAMSAVLGGAEHLLVRPGDESSRAKRLARNVQLILKNESGLHKTADPCQGSYYVESLTKLLVEACK